MPTGGPRLNSHERVVVAWELLYAPSIRTISNAGWLPSVVLSQEVIVVGQLDPSKVIGLITLCNIAQLS